ncbi:MAG: YfhO family protein [Anaerolineae bacterium]|jgi:hypothetical protein|nr:YfhO family protein [Anaerolineae bacterium]MDH7475083.1 YfhO family protein [Anaerolineae bacterium]
MLLSWTGALFLLISWLAVYGLVCWLKARQRISSSVQGDVLAVGVLAGVTAVFFWRVLFTRGAWIPAAGGDLASFLYPTYHYAAESLRRGDIPLWNPHLYLGTPFLADNQTAVFYPINLLFYFLTPELTYATMEWLVVVHVFLSGVFTYFCLRYLEPGCPLHPLAALLGGLAYMLCDVNITHLGNLNIIATTTWLPLIFVFYRRAVVERRAGLAAMAGVFLAVAALVGHGQMLLLTVLGLGMYLLWRWLTGWRGGWRTLLSPALMFALMLAVGLGLAALTLLPAYEMTGYTARAHMPYEKASRYSLPPAALIGLLVPDLYGRGPGGFWGPWDRVEVGYLGVLPLVLAALLLFLRRDRVSGFFAFLTISGLLLALGRYAPVHYLFYRFVPGFDQVRVPARALILFDLGVAGMAALSLDVLLRPLDDRARAVLHRAVRLAPWVGGVTLVGVGLLSRRILAAARGFFADDYRRIAGAANRGLVIFALLLMASLVWLWGRTRAQRAGPLLGLLAVALVAGDLVGLGMKVEVCDYDPVTGFDHPQVLEYLRSDPNYFRVESAREAWGFWQPDFSLLHGLYDLGGLWNPLSLAAYDAFYWSVGRDSPLYDLAGVKYLIALKSKPPGEEKFVLAFDGDPQVDVYLNTAALPRVLLVHRAVTVPDAGAAHTRIHAPDFDPATMVVLLEGQGEPLDVDPGDGERRLGIADFGAGYLEVTVTTPAEGYLVVSDMFYPGWVAMVDGEPRPVLQADYCFRAVRVEPGEHRVRFEFRPRSWMVGLTVSAVTAIVLLVWAVVIAIRG